MKKFMLCFIVLFAVQSTWCYDGDIMSLAHSQLSDFFFDPEMLRKNFEVICPGYTMEFNNALLKNRQCWLTADQSNKTMCSGYKSNRLKCSEPTNHVLRKCLPEQYRELPQFVTDSIVAVTDYVCKTDGEHMYEIYNTCVTTKTNRSQNCERLLASNRQQQTYKPKSISEVCEDFRSLKGCLESHLKSACGSPITGEFYMGLYNVFLKQCDSASPATYQVETDNKN